MQLPPGNTSPTMTMGSAPPPPVALQTYAVIAPKGAAWRKSANFGDTVRDIQGPTLGAQLTGQVVQGDVPRPECRD